MTRYVALLRGVNVGGKNKVAMPRLREVAEGLGYTEVSTYIGSGNLLLATSGSDTSIAVALADAIEAEFGIRIDVAVRTKAQLAKAVAANPYADGDPKQVTIAFLMGPVAATAEERVAALATDAERVTFAGREVYVDYAQGLAKSKLAARFSDVIGVSATTRNLSTCCKLTQLLG